MITIARYARWLLLCALVLFALTPLCFAQDASSVVVVKSLTRDADPVIVKGEQLGLMLGRPIDKLRLYAWRDGKMEPIPFQIDERDDKGELCFPLGAEPNADLDKGLLDANDELVFMIGDVGDKVKAEALPENRRAAMCIVSEDPIDGGKGYAYVLDFDDPPSPSSMDYVDWIADKRTVRSHIYTIGNTNPEFPALLDFMSIGSGPSRNINRLDRFKMRVTASMLAGKANITRTEEDVHVRFLSHIDGPVRVVIKMEFTLTMFMGIQSPSLIRIQTSYGNSSDFPNVVTIPFNIDFLFSNVNVVSSIDFSENMAGAKFYNGYNQQGLEIDGKMSEEERRMDLTFRRVDGCGRRFRGDRCRVFHEREPGAARYPEPAVLQGRPFRGG